MPAIKSEIRSLVTPDGAVILDAKQNLVVTINRLVRTSGNDCKTETPSTQSSMIWCRTPQPIPSRLRTMCATFSMP
jgi:hypothetical protein